MSRASSIFARLSRHAKAPKLAPALPAELIASILSFLRLEQLLLCRLVCKRFNGLIRDDLVLRYRVELGHAALSELSAPVPLLKKLEALRKQQFGWRNLAWSRREILTIDHVRGSPYELVSGIFVTGKCQSSNKHHPRELVFQELPSINATKPPSKVVLDCGMGIVAVTFDVEQDLLVLLEEQGPPQVPPAPFRVHLRSLTSNVPHYYARDPILKYDCTTNWNSYTITMQILGKHLGVLFSSGVLGDSDYERFVVWDWTTGVIRGIVSMPNSRYDSFTFLSHNTFVLPCARTESLNIFIFRPTPPPGEFDRGPAIQHLCALQLPNLVKEAKYVSVTCRSRPTPEGMRSPPPARRLQRPPKYFEPDQESGIVVFSAHVSNAGRGKDISIICNRKSLLRFLAPNPEMLGDPLPKPWESYPMVPATEWWGPPVPYQIWRAICRTIPDRRPHKWIESVHGHRMAQLVYDKSPFVGHLQVMDFNPLFIKRPPLFPEDKHPLVQQSVRRRIMTDINVIPADGFFTEDLVSSLPYYEVTTVATFPLAGLLLDDERVIGLKTSRAGQADVVALDIFII